MANLPGRLRRMTGAEVSWRLRTLARREGQRVRCRLQQPRWERADIRAALSPALVGDAMDRMIRRRDWAAVDAELRRIISMRPARFVLDPRDAEATRRVIAEWWPGAADAARQRADRIVRGEFDLLGYRGLRFDEHDGRIDWHLDPVHRRRMPLRFWAAVPYLDARFGDHKIIWELNRHQYWLALGRAWWLTGDRRYRDAVLRHLESWLRANPPFVGVNWASMLELGFRAMSWTWALHFLLGAPADAAHRDVAVASASGPTADTWFVDLLVGLDRQLTHVAQNLSYYFSPNTHLTGEALALYVVGAALPELKRSAEWVRTGRAVLLAEIGRQIGADGGHAERSTHYHRYTLDFYLLALLTARRIGDTAAAARFEETATRLASFMAAMVDAAGRFPLIGDDDGGMLWPITGRDSCDARDSLALAAVALDRTDLAPWGLQEEVVWIAGSRAAASSDKAAVVSMPPPRCTTTVLDDTGYVAIRDRDGGHLVFDVGAHGYLNGGHAHADALAVTMGVFGRPLLIDPGTSTYTMNPALRDRMRSSASHNTLTIDGRSSSIAAGPFHWASRADAQLHTSRGNARFAWAEATHAGYAGLVHRRSIVHGDGSGWLIVDEVLGRDRHRADTHWHFDPAWRVTCDGLGCLHAEGPDGKRAWVLHDRGALWLGCGDEETGLGWCAPAYGLLMPTAAARVTRIATAPFDMVTWIGTGDLSTPRLERLGTHPDPAGCAIAVCVTRDNLAWTTMLRPGDTAERESRGCGTAEFQTNARLLQYGIADGAVRAISLADFTHLLAKRDGLVSVAADAPVPDLHVARDGSTLELWSTAPPPALRIEGEAISGVRAVRLNGVERPRRDGERHTALVIAAADWSAPLPHRFDRNALCVA
jgi:hypothetical protein